MLRNALLRILEVKSSKVNCGDLKFWINFHYYLTTNC